MNKFFLINKVLDIRTKFESNLSKPNCYTSHPYEPTPEQTEDIDGQN
jgi:hypothetical protein